MERNVESKLQDSEPPTPQSVVKMGLRDRGSMEDPDGTLASVAQCIEQLRRSSSSAQEKESSLKQLLDLINARDSAFSAVGSHSQAVPILVSLLRSGSFQVKVQAAKVLGSLCKDDELRVKVLLGGCIPPLLGLLRSSSAEGQIAAANTIFAVSQGGARDHVGSKIFSTEGVVPVLWKQLQNGLTTENLVEDQLTGALRNLSSSTEGFWSATIEAGGVEILVKLLTTGQSSTLANVCFLLGCMMMEDASVCSRVLSAQATKQLLKLLGSGNEDSVRAEAAGALKSLSAQCKDARREIASCNGIPALINATIAPSKEFMQGEYAQGLQENAMSALANISGGLSYVISSLGESLSSCTSPSQTADTLGALASALMIFDDKAESIRASEPAVVEKTLVKQFKTKLPFLVQERTIEALASLYGNAVLSKKLINSDAKRLLVGLITMATNEDVQDELVRSLLRLCNSEGSLWLALQGRDGVQLLISLLGLSSEQQQECAVALLSLLAKENDESKWAITAAGGIPPLVQILEIGSVKAKEDSALILGNLCNHSEDIRACVESADAVPALLWLLKNGSQNGKDIAAKTLNHLIHKSDTGTISQLTALLTSDIPESKVHILDALKSLLSVAPIQELLREGTAPNDAIETMIKLLNSAQEETQAESASALAFLFDLRKDLRESTIALETLLSAIKLLNVHSEQILKQSSCCLASIFLSIKQNKDVAAIARDTLAPLVLLANSPVLEVAEQATRALANLLLDSEVSAEAFPEDIIMPVTRILHEGGTIDGRTHAAAAVARLLQFRTIDVGISDCVNRAGTVLALVSLLESATVESVATTEALEALALLSRSKASGSQIKPTWAILAEVPDTIEPIVSCIANAPSVLQDKAIEVLCRLCQNQSVVLGNSIGASSVCISSIARRIISSKHRTVQVGGTALLICAAKVNHQRVIEALNESNLCIYLIQSLVEMLRFVQSSDERVENGSKEDISINRETRKQNRAGEFGSSTHVISGENLGIWLLSVLARYENKSKIAILETGAVEVLTDKISKYLSQVTESDSTEDSNAWVCALLLAILFQDRDVIRVHATMRSVPALANILKLEETTNKYFAAQALASLVCNGSRGTLLTVSNSGVANGLISLLGCADTDIHDLLELSEEFALLRNPEEVALERLFRVDDIRNGATSRKAIPALVDLLKPIPDRPRAPFLALGILNHLARDSPTNKIVMVEAGILEALTKYLSLGPQDATEEAAADLLGVLFSSADVRKHESTFGALNQLVAVLRLGGRGARYSAAKALESLFSSDHIRNTDTARQAIQPLVEILNTGFEREQHATIAALIKLLCDGPSRALVVADVELNAVDVLCRILSSNCSLELKGDAAELCYVLFGNTRIRSTNAASRCVEPLVSLLVCEFSPTQHSVVRALDKLMEDEPLADLVAAYGAVIPLVGLLFGQNYSLHEDISRALVKLGKDRPACKMEMVKAGVIESILDIFHEAPHFLCSVFAELLRILTNNSNIAKGPSAAKVIEPIFLLITRPELGPDGQHSSLQVLVNIMEHPQGRANHSLSPYQAILPLVPLLDSHVQAVQQLAAELLSYMLLEERFQKDPTTQQAIGPLIRVLGSGNQISQQKALRALSSIALSWPNEIAKEGGVTELSKVILQSDPPLPHVSWESAASILSSILQFSSEYYLEVPVAVLVKLLHSGTENTVTGALNALLVLESDDSNTTVAMAESGAIEALLELLRSHQSEETAARLLEVLLNNVKVRETKIAKAAISPLSQYLLDPQTQAQQARLLATLALGDLFQAEGLARTTDALSACRALVNVLEDQPTEEMKVVAICALQNLVMYSRSNKRAVAEAGGVQVVLDLIGSSNPDTSVQAAMFIKLLFSNNTIQEYASSETVRVITVIIEKDLWATGSVNEEYLKTLNALLGNFPRLRATEPATLCIPHLITALKTGSEPTQEAALDSLFLLRQAWSACPAEVSQAQSVAAAEAIPFLQYLIQSGPPRFQEKVELLLQCLPGTLVVIIKRGNNLKQSVGNASAYCKVTLGHNPPKLTKIADGPTPEWDESFSWAFESPPKGQKLHISCKNKSKFGKKKFGKVTIQIDRVVMLGAVAGEYALLPESRSGPRNLEIEFLWSNKLQAS